MRTFARLQFDRFCIKATDNMLRWYFTHDLFAWSIERRKSSSPHLLPSIPFLWEFFFLLHLSRTADKKKVVFKLVWLSIDPFSSTRSSTAPEKCLIMSDRNKVEKKEREKFRWMALEYVALHKCSPHLYTYIHIDGCGWSEFCCIANGSRLLYVLYEHFQNGFFMWKILTSTSCLCTKCLLLLYSPLVSSRMYSESVCI